MAIIPGKRNRRVIIERNVGVRDETGQKIDDWQVLYSRWAEYKGPRGMSFMRASEAGVPEAPIPGSWSMCFSPEITEDMRLVLDGDIFSITAVSHDFAKRLFTDVVVALGGNDG